MSEHESTPIEDIRAAKKIIEENTGLPHGDDEIILYPWQRGLLGLPDNAYSVTRDKFIELCNKYFEK